MTGHCLSICMIRFHEKRDDDDVSTWISSQIEVRVAFDFFSHYVDVNRDHLFNDFVNSRKNTFEITLKSVTFYDLLQIKRPHLEIS